MLSCSDLNTGPSLGIGPGRLTWTKFCRIFLLIWDKVAELKCLGLVDTVTEIKD